MDSFDLDDNSAPVGFTYKGVSYLFKDAVPAKISKEDIQDRIADLTAIKIADSTATRDESPYEARFDLLIRNLTYILNNYDNGPSCLDVLNEPQCRITGEQYAHIRETLIDIAELPQFRGDWYMMSIKLLSIFWYTDVDKSHVYIAPSYLVKYIKFLESAPKYPLLDSVITQLKCALPID